MLLLPCASFSFSLPDNKRLGKTKVEDRVKLLYGVMIQISQSARLYGCPSCLCGGLVSKVFFSGGADFHPDPRATDLRLGVSYMKLATIFALTPRLFRLRGVRGKAAVNPMKIVRKNCLACPKIARTPISAVAFLIFLAIPVPNRTSANQHLAGIVRHSPEHEQ